jgi:hypothetical protein
MNEKMDVVFLANPQFFDNLSRYVDYFCIFEKHLPDLIDRLIHFCDNVSTFYTQNPIMQSFLAKHRKIDPQIAAQIYENYV